MTRFPSIRNNLAATVYTTKSTLKIKKPIMNYRVYKVLVRSNPYNTVLFPVSKCYYVSHRHIYCATWYGH